MARKIFSFPEVVNEYAARLVANGVVIMTALVVFGGQRWVLIPLAYGFVARVFTGPTMSPLGRLASQVIAPALKIDKPVPGKPKRFAQGIGAVLSVAGLVSWLLGASTLATVFAGMILFAASLEAGIGFCLGCVIYGQLSKRGIVADACPECANIGLRPQQRLAA